MAIHYSRMVHATPLYDFSSRYRMWYGSCLSCNKLPGKSDAHPNPHDGCGHPTWHQQYPDQTPWITPVSALLCPFEANGDTQSITFFVCLPPFFDDPFTRSHAF